MGRTSLSEVFLANSRGSWAGCCWFSLWFLLVCVSVCSCREFKNLNSFFAIIMGMSNPAVSRLSQTWEVNFIEKLNNPRTVMLWTRSACCCCLNPRFTEMPSAFPDRNFPPSLRSSMLSLRTWWWVSFSSLLKFIVHKLLAVFNLLLEIFFFFVNVSGFQWWVLQTKLGSNLLSWWQMHKIMEAKSIAWLFTHQPFH